jgi:hypothetical protein
MDQETMALTQKERDRLDLLKQAQRKQITQRKAAEQMQVSERWVRELLRRMKTEKDRVVVHKLRGRPSHRRRSAEERDRIVKILSDPRYAGYGPTLAAERLQEKHGVRIGREALRQLMIQAGLWRARARPAEAIHAWRPRRSQFGELVQWDSSTHDWLEGRGPQMKLIRLIDDATSRSLLQFVEHDSVEENFGLLERWLRRFGRMHCCYTDKAALFVTTEKHRRDRPGQEVPAREMLPTQIGRALQELGILHLTAHSPQAKGRVERAFATDQDRLVKNLRDKGVRTLAQANRYLEQVYEPWCEAHCTVPPADPEDAHRPLERQHDLAAILSLVQPHQVYGDYTVQILRHKYRILPADIVPGLRGACVRVEHRLDGSLAISFQGQPLRFELCAPVPQPTIALDHPVRDRQATLRAHQTPWGQNYNRMPDLPLWKAAKARG